ncbi:hypothetical protein K1T71_012441, partial [Dendrolimus kikuchii]
DCTVFSYGPRRQDPLCTTQLISTHADVYDIKQANDMKIISHLPNGMKPK